MARWQGWLGALSLSLVCLAATGCGQSDGITRGQLSGKITHKGNPLPEGSSIALYNPNGGGATAVIDASGNYRLKQGAPVGSYTVIINPPAKMLSPEEAMKASMEKKSVDNSSSEVPAKYRDPSTSPAKVEIKEGQNEFSLDMTDE
jgi:hypothetical protein